MSRVIHCNLSVRGALKRNKTEMKRFGRCLLNNDGKHLTGEQARDWLLDELSKGRECLPLGPPCDGFDYVTGCPGHEDEEIAALPPESP